MTLGRPAQGAPRTAVHLPGVRPPGRGTYLLATLVLGVACEAIHVAVGQMTLGRPWREVTLGLDQAIPVVPHFVWVYELWALFLFLPAAVLDDRSRVQRALLSALGACLSGYVLFLMFPVRIPKPELGPGLAEQALAAVYRKDELHGGAYLPSLHVATAWIAAVATCRPGRPRLRELVVVGVAAAITVSTVLTKQHVVADVAAGLLWGALWWRVAGPAMERITRGAPSAAEAWQRLVAWASRRGLAVVLRGITLPALAWWGSGRLARAVGWPGPALAEDGAWLAVALLLVGVAGLVLSLRTARRGVGILAFCALFAGVAVGEGDGTRALLGSALLGALLVSEGLVRRAEPAPRAAATVALPAESR